ncbi:MAG: chromate efflux transporter [Chromatiales bacterium]
MKLGLTSFGGPIAHLAYFHRELIERRGWLGQRDYAQLIALCQFLPGPASSQLGFVLGLLRGGWLGALAAFIAFTLPSALLLVAFAALLPMVSGGIGDAALQGLKLLAVAVVAHGVLGMGRQLCPDRTRIGIATAAVVVLLLFGQAWMQLLVVALGALAGLMLCREVSAVESTGLRLGYGPRLGIALLGVFGLLLIGLPLLAAGSGGLLAVAEAFYRSGALVFGGGHVVLPLLEEAVVAPGWVSQDEFLAGYGAAQAVPGPMFTLAAYLGARLPGADGGLVGASVALAAIFLPGFLLAVGVLPLWRSIVSRPAAARAVAGVNAAVVGLLGAALYDPVWTSAVRDSIDVAIALVGFMLLATWRVSVLWVVAWCVGASLAATMLFGA